MTESLVSSPEIILDLIPQRTPFVLVDKIYEHTEKEILSGFTVPVDHILVDERQFLSEAGIIEHFAQSIALHQGYNFYLKNEPAPVGYIGSIKNIDVIERPKVGEEIKTRITVLNQIMGVTMVSGEVFLNGKIIAHGEMRTIIARELD
jgi:3-hydroxyacyl-[acyl-carrier-protein] dehydratase